MTTPRVTRPDLAGDVGENRDRIRILEALSPSANTGTAYMTVRNNTGFDALASSATLVTWDEFDTNDLTVFGTGTGSPYVINNVCGDDKIFLQKQGIYLLSVNVVPGVDGWERWTLVYGVAALLTSNNPTVPGYSSSTTAFQALQFDLEHKIVVSGYEEDDNNGNGPFIYIRVGNEEVTDKAVTQVAASLVYLPSTCDLFGNDEIYVC